MQYADWSGMFSPRPSPLRKGRGRSTGSWLERLDVKHQRHSCQRPNRLSRRRNFYDGVGMEIWFGGRASIFRSLWFIGRARRSHLVPSGPLLITLAWLGSFTFLPAAENASPTNRVVHAAPNTSADLLTSFHLVPGFKMELVAREPMVSSPVAIAFDESGRLFVAEMRDYPNRGEAKPHLGRVRLLTDPDDSGVYQNSAIYADDLRFPSAIGCYAGGVFVAAVPDLLYLRDTKGDGGADLRRVVFTGFGSTNAPNPDFLPNNFNWALDNRIHGVTAGIGGVLTASNWPSGPVSLDRRDFAFAPRTLDLIPETGPAQSGLTFDDAGRRFVSDLVHPLRLPMYEVRYTDRNPFYAKAPAMSEVVNSADRIFQVTTSKPDSSNASKPSEPSTGSISNRLAPSWMANARGPVIYRGHLFPTNYLGSTFIPDPEAHLVHHLLLSDRGLEIVARRPRDETKLEFLASSDASFRPVQAVNGPDGALYIVDMQNGDDRGRIYRVVPTNFKQAKPPELGKARIYDLVAALASNNGWYCDTAGRLLYERRDASAVPLLTNMLNNSRLPLARLRALHALDGLGALAEAQVVAALHDTDARVREHGVLLSERLMTNGLVAGTLWSELKGLTADAAIRVRYQLAFTAGQAARPDKTVVLEELLRRDLADPWMRNAILSSVAEGAANLFIMLCGDVRFRNDVVGQEFLRQLALTLGTAGHLDEVRQVIDFLARTPLDRLLMYGLSAALGEGLSRTRSSLAMVDPQNTLQPLYASAFQSAIDSFTPPAVRIEAVRLAGASPLSFTETSDWLLALCNPQPSLELRAAAIATLVRYDNPATLAGLLERWSLFPPALRAQALAALLSRQIYVGPVLDAVEKGRIAVADFSSTQMDFLRTYEDPGIGKRASKVFGPFTAKHPAVMEQFKQALRLPAFAERGRATFTARCSNCHRLEGTGRELGPNLAAAKVLGKEKLLSAILEPSAAIEPGYETSVVPTFEGQNLVGIKTDDNLTTITLRQPRGESVVYPHLNVRNVYAQPWSLMPAGLERGLTSQDLADLLEYLMTVEK